MTWVQRVVSCPHASFYELHSARLHSPKHEYVVCQGAKRYGIIRVCVFGGCGSCWRQDSVSPAWVPGFGRFFDDESEMKQSKDGNNSDLNKGAGGSGGGGGDSGDGKGGGDGGPKGSPDDNQQTQQIMSMLFITAALMWLLSLRSGNSGKELDWQTFRKEWLGSDRLERLEVVNNDIVRIVAKKSCVVVVCVRIVQPRNSVIRCLCGSLLQSHIWSCPLLPCRID